MRPTPAYLKQEKTALQPLEILEQEKDQLTSEEKKETEKTIGRLLTITHRKAFFRAAITALEGCSEFWNPNVADKRNAPGINKKQRSLTTARIRTSLRALLAIRDEKRSAAEQRELMRVLQQKMRPMIAKADTVDPLVPFGGSLHPSGEDFDANPPSSVSDRASVLSRDVLDITDDAVNH